MNVGICIYSKEFCVSWKFLISPILFTLFGWLLACKKFRKVHRKLKKAERDNHELRAVNEALTYELSRNWSPESVKMLVKSIDRVTGVPTVSFIDLWRTHIEYWNKEVCNIGDDRERSQILTQCADNGRVIVWLSDLYQISEPVDAPTLT